jgi:hypothetical protein
MNNDTFEFHYEHEDEDEKIWDWLVEFAYQPGDPGNYSGPREDCYPAEAYEIEIVKITEAANGTLSIPISGRFFSKAILDKLDAACFAHIEKIKEEACS